MSASAPQNRALTPRRNSKDTFRAAGRNLLLKRKLIVSRLTSFNKMHPPIMS